MKATSPPLPNGATQLTITLATISTISAPTSSWTKFATTNGIAARG